jgi:hypothetical protein
MTKRMPLNNWLPSCRGPKIRLSIVARLKRAGLQIALLLRSTFRASKIQCRVTSDPGLTGLYRPVRLSGEVTQTFTTGKKPHSILNRGCEQPLVVTNRQLMLETEFPYGEHSTGVNRSIVLT